MQSDEFKQYAKLYFSANRDEIQSKAKAACQDKYGADCYFLSEEYRSKLPAIKALLAEKRAEIQEKSMATKRRNGTFNASKPEELFYEALVEKFGAEDVVRQYKCASYPFNCDFYVKSKGLFIELNLSWTHGGHRFDPSIDAEKLRLWEKKAKTSAYYANAVKTWTKRDAEKFETAERNKINYKAFYSKTDAFAWLSAAE